ncbi:NADH dehydrogenase [ubiquinone] 1 alpha subcomplex subunit 7-like [Ptychodera flava]|uniref:NADH dehydrogenase [ubiquinone] 1 alpha subcomplex subunit 7-like n=1 Tax=Ptychodera flava TaxID=63121 RepID=UPI00396A0390
MATATKYIQWLRNILSGRNYQSKLQLRYAREQSPRTIPEPNLPDGPSHRLSDNYYLSRDGRRLAAKPEIVYSQVKRLPAQAASSTSSVLAEKPPPRPGTEYQWNISKDEPYL